MPAFGDILKPDEITQVSSFVAFAFGQGRECASAQEIAAGKQIFAAELRGLPRRRRQGQPRDGRAESDGRDLALRLEPAAIAAQVKSPRTASCRPGARLGDTTVKELTVYVHSLGGGE
jgi:cytochrome c oxidase cbb3-type subunit 3